MPKAWAKQIDLGFEEPGLPVTISGNATMLAEMLNNLLDNAIRYTPDGGHVTVRVTTAPFEPFVFIDVDDTGPGIPVAERERVMQRFYRILGTQAEGSGLGLAIVREIVASMADATLLRGVAAVIVGFVVLTFGSVIAGRAIASFSGPDAEGAMTASFLTQNLVSRFVVAALAGYLTAKAAPRKPLLHGLALAGLVAFMAAAALFGALGRRVMTM